MIHRLRNALGLAKKPLPRHLLHFDRPLVVFQSDDWGRVGIRDQDGWRELQSAGIALGAKPYDFYSLETAEDLLAIREVFRKHHDSTGRRPSIVMNFIMANVDFDRFLEPGLKEIPLRPLIDGLPGKWLRPNLFETYQEGIREGLFYPALHGLTHFCQRAIERERATGGDRAQLLNKLWHAQTPYIHWRMPWIGYEYWDPESEPAKRFLPADEQRTVIAKTIGLFRDLFSTSPLSACAPGYRANDDTRQSWYENGVRIAQNGPGEEKVPYLDAKGMMHMFRTIEMEPAVDPCDLNSLVAQAGECFVAGLPAVVSIHSINFHSTLRDFCTSTLKLLNEFLTALENKWPNLLYVHDGDLLSIATRGTCASENENVNVGVSVVGAN